MQFTDETVMDEVGKEGKGLIVEGFHVRARNLASFIF